MTSIVQANLASRLRDMGRVLPSPPRGLAPRYGGPGARTRWSRGTRADMTARRVTDPGRVRDLLAAQDVRPRKQFGQNFLVDDAVVEAIRQRVAEKAPELVVEIGPGLGALTEAVLEVPRRLLAIEVDPRLAHGLSTRLAPHAHVEIRVQDILAVDLTQEFAGQKVLVLGSLPYRITSPILKHLIRHRGVISESCLITQWEVAGKVMSSPGKDGSPLGVLVTAYSDVTPLVKISRRAFWPVPEVDSAYWEMAFRAEPRFSVDDTLFFQLVRLLYENRRKMIRRALQRDLSRDEIISVLERAEIDGTARGETLTFPELDRLAQACAPWLNTADVGAQGHALDHEPR